MVKKSSRSELLIDGKIDEHKSLDNHAFYDKLNEEYADRQINIARLFAIEEIHTGGSLMSTMRRVTRTFTKDF